MSLRPDPIVDVLLTLAAGAVVLAIKLLVG